MVCPEVKNGVVNDTKGGVRDSGPKNTNAWGSFIRSSSGCGGGQPL